MEVLDKWNMGHGKEFNESLVESLCADSSGIVEDYHIKHIADALKAKAGEEGVNVDEDYNAIQEKLEKRWFRDYEGIYEAINNMHKNLGGRPFEKKQFKDIYQGKIMNIKTYIRLSAVNADGRSFS